MNITTSDVDDITIIVIDGMLTIGSEETYAGVFKKQLDRGRRKIVLDMTRVKYIDSLGIGQIAGSYTQINDLGGILVLARVNQKIEELLHMTGLENHIQTFPTVDQAIGGL